MRAVGVLKRIEEESHEHYLPIIGPAKGAILDDIVRKRKPLKALEVGTLVGYSAIRIARLLPEGGELTCVEVNPEMAAVARSNLSDAGLGGVVRILVGDAKKLLPGLKGPFDLVLIDAAKNEYFHYLKSCEHLLRKGSVVVADNTVEFADTLAGYLEYVRTSGSYSSRSVDAPLNADPSYIDAMEISVRL